MNRRIAFLLTGLLLGTLDACPPTLGPVPAGPEREEWIAEHMRELEKLRQTFLRIPEGAPKTATRPTTVEMVDSVKTDESYKVVLAVLGIPHIREGQGQSPRHHEIP